mgnify:CR=1 FL=1
MAWHASQAFVVDRWLVDFPLALVPLWQLEQFPEILAWLKVAGLHALVAWQVPHSAVVGMCLDDLPGARVPL